MTLTRAKIKLTEGTWLTLRSPSTAPHYLRTLTAGLPVQVVKRVKREMFLRGQREFQLSVANILVHFDLALSLKLVNNCS